MNTVTTAQPRVYPSPRAYALRRALVAMVTRYGVSVSRAAYAIDSDDRAAHERHNRACIRRFAAVQRLADALAEVAR